MAQPSIAADGVVANEPMDAAVNHGDDKPAGAADDEKAGQRFTHSAAEVERMTQYLEQRIDRGAVRKTLATASGRRVDCVDIHAQPALRNPALAGHVVQRAPKSIAGMPASGNGPRLTESLFEMAANGASTEVAGCPQDTVPIADVTLGDLRRFKSLEDYFRKIPSEFGIDPAARFAPSGSFQKAVPPVHYGPTSLHQYAHAYRYVTNWGAQANINIWRPYTELNSEFSLGQIWVVGGSGSGLQTLEVGVQKYRNLYGDGEPHLFIYSTRDGYQNTGCYNNSCGDFVQVSSSIYPGAALGPVSVSGGAQYEVNVHWFKDMDGGAWWLNFQGQWVGYYPRGLYNAAGVLNRAAEIDFGGEIIDYRNLNLHTATDMGSGAFPSAWWRYAAYMRLLRYNYTTTTNPNTVWYTAVTGLTTSRSDAMCYDISSLYTNDANWGSYFFYGGPGYHYDNCR